MILDKRVTRCIGSCPLQKHSMDGMYCSHPALKGWAGYIITRDGPVIPMECPLKRGPLTITYSL